MNFIGIIPARYASTRFPGKPLVDINGKSMIQRVYEQATQSKMLKKVLVATDDERIYHHVQQFGGNTVLTKIHHQSGTDRCYEAAVNSNESIDVVINIQGDEPFINPSQIDLLCNCFINNAAVSIATLIKKISSTDVLLNENVVKVVVKKNGEAVYFSRSPLPYYRGIDAAVWLNKHVYYKHIGIYGYTVEALKRITQLPQSALEIAESLEQLRWIENGFTIQTAVTENESHAVDTPDDLKKIMKHFVQ